jgi:hypothetical protein
MVDKRSMQLGWDSSREGLPGTEAGFQGVFEEGRKAGLYLERTLHPERTLHLALKRCGLSNSRCGSLCCRWGQAGMGENGDERGVVEASEGWAGASEWPSRPCAIPTKPPTPAHPRRMCPQRGAALTRAVGSRSGCTHEGATALAFTCVKTPFSRTRDYRSSRLFLGSSE